MARKKTAEGPAKSEDDIVVCWAEGACFVMPNDLSKHAQMTIEEIKKQPEAVWDEEQQKWRRK